MKVESGDIKDICNTTFGFKPLALSQGFKSSSSFLGAFLEDLLPPPIEGVLEECKEVVECSVEGIDMILDLFSIRPHFDVSYLNMYLKQNGEHELTPSQSSDLMEYLKREGIIGISPSSVLMGEAIRAKYLIKRTVRQVLTPDISKKVEAFKKLVVSGAKQDIPALQKEFQDMLQEVEYLPDTVIDGLQLCWNPYSIVAEDVKSFEASINQQELGQELELSGSQQENIVSYIRLLIHLRENVGTIVSTVQSQRSLLLDLDKPEITLKKLIDMFEESIQEKIDVVEAFSDNQCHFVITVAEKKWSLKSIITAVSVIVLGLAQIVAGAILLVFTYGAGVHFANGLIGEGVSDIVFGIKGLWTGYCSPTEYLKHKLLSLAISLATAGVGAWLGRGVQASTYAVEAFGAAGKEAVKNTLKQFAKTAGVIAEQVGKKIITEVAMAAGDAMIEITADVIVQKLSQAIRGLSSDIIDCFSKELQSEELLSKMYRFLQQNPKNPENSLRQITQPVLKQTTFVDLWDSIEENATRIIGVVAQGSFQALNLISQIASLISEMLKAVQIVASVSATRDDLIRALDESFIDQSDSTTDITHEDTDKKLQAIVRNELTTIKDHFAQKISERCEGVVRKTVNLAGQQLKKGIISVGTKLSIKAKEKYHEWHFQRLEQHHETIRKNDSLDTESKQSQLHECREKMKKCMSRTRSPKIFAKMIKEHNAELGHAFATPALEILFNKKIVVVGEDGTPLMNVKHHSDGDTIVVKHIPATETEPAHFYYGDKKFSPEQGSENNCLIHAVQEALPPEQRRSPKEIRDHIAKACLTKGHPCNQYIKSGIARNYVHIGLVGGAPKRMMSFKDEDSFEIIRLGYFWKDVKDFAEKVSPEHVMERKRNGEMIDLCHRFPDSGFIAVMKQAEDLIRSPQKQSAIELLQETQRVFWPSVTQAADGKSAYTKPSWLHDWFGWLGVKRHDSPELKEHFLEFAQTEFYVRKHDQMKTFITHLETKSVMTMQEIADRGLNGDLMKPIEQRNFMTLNECRLGLHEMYKSCTNAVPNLRYGDGKINRHEVGAQLDLLPGEVLSEEIKRYSNYLDSKFSIKIEQASVTSLSV